VTNGSEPESRTHTCTECDYTYTEVQVTVTLLLNGQTYATLYGYEDAQIDLPVLNNVHGFTFMGWSTVANADVVNVNAMHALNGTIYNPGEAMYLNADTTVYAVWVANDLLSGNVMVKYHPNGGVDSSNDTVIVLVKGSSHTIREDKAAMSRPGAVFLGWTGSQEDVLTSTRYMADVLYRTLYGGVTGAAGVGSDVQYKNSKTAPADPGGEKGGWGGVLVLFLVAGVALLIFAFVQTGSGKGTVHKVKRTFQEMSGGLFGGKNRKKD
jgi:hypothetical protein